MNSQELENGGMSRIAAGHPDLAGQWVRCDPWEAGGALQTDSSVDFGNPDLVRYA